MSKRENIIQAVFKSLNDIKEQEKLILFRNKEIEIELETEQKLVNLTDGSAEVIDTVLSPRVDTIEQTINVELYLQDSKDYDINTELDKFEETIRNAIKSSEQLKTLIRTLEFTYSQTEILEPQSGTQVKKAYFDVVVVFDDI
ncbi:MAG: hypothetical protein GY793_11210 [Proteobacteria bacterium]|nr:hypothetical protein [Pseudomonadota bacterium]